VLELGDEEDPYDYHVLDTGLWFKQTNKSIRDLPLDRWGINGPELGRGLCFVYDDNSLVNGSPLNRCIVEVTGGRAEHPWSGNILGLRRKNFSHYFYESVVMEEDLKPFVTYLDEYWRVEPIR